MIEAQLAPHPQLTVHHALIRLRYADGHLPPPRRSVHELHDLLFFCLFLVLVIHGESFQHSTVLNSLQVSLLKSSLPAKGATQPSQRESPYTGGQAERPSTAKTVMN